MSRTKAYTLLTGLLVLLLIGCAMALRVLSRIGPGGPAYTLLRSGIYIFLIAAWGVSVRLRSVQWQARRYLTAVAVLMVL